MAIRQSAIDSRESPRPTLASSSRVRGGAAVGRSSRAHGGERPQARAHAREEQARGTRAVVGNTNYDVTFPLFTKIEVNGPGTHPLYRWLKREQKGLFGTEAIKWNFTKFLVD